LNDRPENEPDRIFTLEGRPAAGLYLLGWVLPLVGLGVLLVAFEVGGAAHGVLLMGSLLLVGAGLSSAAGYQVVARARRPAAAYHGPSPLILFALQIVVITALGAVLLVLRAPSPTDDPIGFLLYACLEVAGYLLIVWLFVIRTGALTWRGLGLSRLGPARLAADVAGGAGLMVVVAVGSIIWTAALVLLLGTVPPSVLPNTQTAASLATTALAAGVIVPIGEETFFRGYSLTAWWHDLGPRSALIRSTLFFALVHTLNISVAPGGDAWTGFKQAVIEVLVIGPVGLALGWLFLRRGLIASIAGHAAFNLFGIALTALAPSVLLLR
jgi:membrane protease YdiL (CAAX protease family)